MSDNRKYYYMRLREDFFDSNEVSLIEAMDNGITYSNILLKLYLRSIRGKGRLMFNDRVPYTPKLLATIFKHKEEDVAKALVLFEDLALIETLKNGAIYMLNFEIMIGESSTEADRQREYRLRIKEEKELLEQQVSDDSSTSDSSDTNVHQMSHQMFNKSTPDIDIDKTEDKIKDKIKEQTKPDETEEKKETKKELNQKEEFDKEKKFPYGLTNNVLLTPKEFGRLKILFPEKYETYINDLGKYMETTETYYENHFDVIMEWSTGY